MNNQDVSVERFFRVSSIEYRVSSIEYQLDTRYTMPASIEYRVNLHLVGTVLSTVT